MTQGRIWFQIEDGDVHSVSAAESDSLPDPSSEPMEVGGNGLGSASIAGPSGGKECQLSFQDLFREADKRSGVKARRTPVMSTGRQAEGASSGMVTSSNQPELDNDVLGLRSGRVYVIPPDFENGMCINFYAARESGDDHTKMEDPTGVINDLYRGNVALDWDNISATIRALDNSQGGGSSSGSRARYDGEGSPAGSMGLVLTNRGLWSWSTADIWSGGLTASTDGFHEPLARLFFGPVFEEDVKMGSDFERLMEESRASDIKRVGSVVAERPLGPNEVPDKKNMTREEKSKFLLGQKLMRMSKLNLQGNLETAGDIERRIASMRSSKRSMGLTSGRGRFLGNLEHFNIATQHRNCKTDLTLKEMLNYHAPRMTRKTKLKNWKLSIRKPSSSSGSNLELRIDRPEDLSLLEGDFVCVEYSEERPPVLSNLGMASVIINFFRAEALAESSHGGKLAITGGRDPKLVQARGGLAKRTTSRQPKHIEMLEQRKSNKKDRTEDVAMPEQRLGKTEILDEHDEFEFLGELSRGEMQSCIKNNLYRAPLFAHDVPKTDFLLVPIASDDRRRESNHFELRRIPHMLLAGQSEPLQKVMKPSTTKQSESNRKMVLLNILRLLERKHEIDGKAEFREIITNFYTACNITRQCMNETVIRKILKEVADDIGGDEWVLQEQDLDDFERSEDVAKSLDPEHVCLHESSVSADFDLEMKGIDCIDLSRMEAWLIRMEAHAKFKEVQIKNLEKIFKNFSKQSPRRATAEKLFRVLERNINILHKKRLVGRYIFERLIAAPWNTTDAFVSHRDRMELVGPADPTGRGEGFCFYRRLKQTTSGASTVQKRASTGLDQRKVTTKQAIEFLVQIGTSRTRDEIQKMPRWDRINAIRDLVNKAKREGKAIPAGLEMFVDQNNTGAGGGIDDNVPYMELCEDIWNKQKTALSDPNTPDSDDDDHLSELERKAAENTSSRAYLAGLSSSDAELARQSSEEVRNETDRREFEALRNQTLQRQSSEESRQQDAIRTALQSWERPAFVTKRITRCLMPDGSEHVEVKFIFSPNANLRRRSETSVQRRRLSLSRHEKREMPCDSELEDAEEEPVLGDDATGADMTLKLGIINSKAKRGRDEFNADIVGNDRRALFRQSSFARRSSADAVVDRNARLPQVQFASELDSIVMEQWSLKRNRPFIYPINYDLVPAYRQKVPNPIWLQDIRQKIGRFQYRTVDDFVSDFELLANNAKLFNGQGHQFSKDAETMRMAVLKRVNHDRDHGLPDKLRLLEEVIRFREDQFRHQRER